MKAAIFGLLAFTLFSCSSNNPPPYQPTWPVPGPGQWASGFGENPSPNVGTSFPIPGGQGIHYVYTPASLAGKSSITLTYTVSGDATFGIDDPSDHPPPQVTLFIWQAGDNLTCVGNYVNDRQFSNARSPLQNGTYTLTVPLDQADWHNCIPNNGTPANLSQAVNNSAYAGFTAGGAFFDGHGVYVTSGSATFTINSFSVQ